MSSLTISSALATPQIAKGKPCTACHKGSPPSKYQCEKISLPAHRTTTPSHVSSHEAG
jgi:hypothetical protein